MTLNVLRDRRLGAVMISDLTLDQLRKACERALKRYLRVCLEGHLVLMKSGDLPISETQQNEVFFHRRKEIDAHSAYTNARTKLWRYLTHSPSTTLDETGSESVKRIRQSNAASRGARVSAEVEAWQSKQRE
jgi:hypothetical protein